MVQLPKFEVLKNDDSSPKRQLTKLANNLRSDCEFDTSGSVFFASAFKRKIIEKTAHVVDVAYTGYGRDILEKLVLI